MTNKGSAFETICGGEWLEDGRKRWEAFSAQSVAAEKKALDEARKAVDEGARMMKEGLEYAARMSAEWRRMATELAEKATAATRPQA